MLCMESGSSERHCTVSKGLVSSKGSTNSPPSGAIPDRIAPAASAVYGPRVL